jgi:type 1 fimbriae regulatory protein FimB/type 1 fimbriae regulatory protein FimE
MVLIAYRHGLRACEVCTLRWEDADLTAGKLHVQRAKNGAASVHPLVGVELRALRRIQREQEPKSPYVFTSKRGAPFTRHGFGKLIIRLVARLALTLACIPHAAPQHPL